MKIKLSTYITGALFLLVINTASAQKLGAGSASYTVQSETGNQASGDAVNTDMVSAKVLKSFHRVYGDLPGAKWYGSDNGFMVTFRINDMNNTVYYKTNGVLDASLHYYLADRLASSVRNLVQSAFPNYNLFHVVELQKNGATAYYVKIQDATTIKTVKVVGEEWELVETLVKR